MASSSECNICFERFDSNVKVPKNLPCGHVKCLQCLKRVDRCDECRVLITIQPERLTTNYTILQDATGVANQWHCDNCKKVADWACEKDGHSLRSLGAYRSQQTESSLKAVDAWADVLERLVPKVLHLKEATEKQLKQSIDVIVEDQDKAADVKRRLTAFVNGTARPGADHDAALRDAGECSLRLPLWQRSLKFLELDQRLCRLEVQGGGETWATSLDLGNAANLKPEIVSTVQYLMYLLCKEGHMQKQVKGEKGPKSRDPSSRPLGAAGDGQGQGQAPRGRQGQGQGLGQGRQNDGRASWTITDEGVLDLGLSARGESPLEETEKAAILKSTKMVTHLIGNKCSEDPYFYTKVILKHGPYIEKLELRQVHQQHLDMLASMRMLKDLKLIGFIGQVSVGMSPQPGCVLRSLCVKLPTSVQFDLWRAYASSLSNIVLRIEVSTLGIHNTVRTVAAKTPNLRNLLLSRYNADHTPGECLKQLNAVRGVVPNGVTVSCSVCK